MAKAGGRGRGRGRGNANKNKSPAKKQQQNKAQGKKTMKATTGASRDTKQKKTILSTQRRETRNRVARVGETRRSPR